MKTGLVNCGGCGAVTRMVGYEGCVWGGEHVSEGREIIGRFLRVGRGVRAGEVGGMGSTRFNGKSGVGGDKGKMHGRKVMDE